MNEFRDKLRRDAERELVDAALGLDDIWKDLGSCETTGERAEASFARFIDAIEAVRAEWAKDDS